MFGLYSRRIYSTTIHHNTDKTEKVVAADLCAFCASVHCCIQNWSRAEFVQRIDVCFVFKEDLLNDHSSKQRILRRRTSTISLCPCIIAT